jgi:N-acetylglucosaminyl-diphospho-decaprenol L-rhamnosyltransferase
VKHDVGLAALIVNYDTGSYAECCVESLLREWEAEGRSREKLQVVLVDNASPSDQEPYLRRIEALGVEVIRSKENLGYAAGMNLCYERTRGVPGDVVAILNPDLHFLPGTVGTLIDYILDNPRVGVVDPTTSVDPLGVFNLPRNLLPTPLEHLRVMLAQMHPFFTRWYTRYRHRKAMVWWTSPEPVWTDMLSGCCLFMRRAVIDEMGRVMDPAYPLYFEDTDLFRTLNSMGYGVVHHTRARILHHWSRSARVAGLTDDGPTRRFEIGREYYYRKFYGPLGRGFFRAVNALARRWPTRWLGRPLCPMTDLGEFVEPPVIEMPYPCRFVLEMAIDPTFAIAAGTFGEGPRWECPPEAWDWLFGHMTYYVRGVDLDTGKQIGCWRYFKPQEGRSEAMRAEELAGYGERLLSAAPLR